MKMKTELNHEDSKTRRRKTLGALVPSWFPLPVFSLCALAPLWLSLLCLTCTAPQKRQLTVMPESEKKYVAKKLYSVKKGDIILAEKDGMVLVRVNGVDFWTKVDRENIAPLPKTNVFGFCENTATVTNIIYVYELPDISSKVVDKISKGMLVQIVETADYFVKISTPKVETYGWVLKKDLSDYSDYSPRSVAKAKVTIKEDSANIYIGDHCCPK